MIIIKLVPYSTHYCIVMDAESRGTIWELKTRKIVRTLQNFSGIFTEDEKLGLHAPTRGGLHVIIFTIFFLFFYNI